MKNHEKHEKPRSDPPYPILTKSNQENLQKCCFLIAGRPSEQVCEQGFAWIGLNLRENNRKPALVGFRTKCTEKQENPSKTSKNHENQETLI